jgi:hypothetical protein
MHKRYNTLPAEHLRLCPVHAPDNIDERLRRLDEAHVAPLNRWVRETRADPRLPPRAGATIPWFDPESAGVDATMLFLLQDPSEVATSTGFISTHNCDATARNTTLACAAAGIGYDKRCHWNVFPWWVNTAGKDTSRPAMRLRQAAPLAASMMPRLLALFPQLAVIVVAGDGTGDAFRLAEQQGLVVADTIAVVEIGSLSALGGFSRHRDRLIARLTEAHAVTRMPASQRRRAIHRRFND